MFFSVCEIDIKGFRQELKDQKRSGCSNSCCDSINLMPWL